MKPQEIPDSVETVEIQPRMLSYLNAAVYTGLSVVTLWRLVKSGEIEPLRGRTVRFDVKELDEFIDRRRALRQLTASR